MHKEDHQIREFIKLKRQQSNQIHFCSENYLLDCEKMKTIH